MSYKKRAKAGWCTGKKECKEKIYKERQYGKDEIRQTMTEIEAGEDYRYPGGGKKKKNERARMEYWAEWYERKYQQYGDDCTWYGSYRHRAKEQRMKIFKKYGAGDEELRRCNYCRVDTPTHKEDCTICKMSKPHK